MHEKKEGTLSSKREGVRPRMGIGARRSSASVASINHNACYHKLHNLSNIIIVLVFSEMASFVRMILQREENKGVELTVCRGNGLYGQSIDLENVRQGHQFDDDGSSHFSTDCG